MDSEIKWDPNGGGAVEEFYRRRSKNNWFYYIMIGFLILGICLLVGGFVFLFFV